MVILDPVICHSGGGAACGLNSTSHGNVRQGLSGIYMISNFEAFEWHEEKRLSNFEKHKIDFEDAAKVFQNPFLRLPCRIATELQFRAVGVVSDDILITVVYTDRLGVCRIISARKARANERKAYYKAFGQ